MIHKKLATVASSGVQASADNTGNDYVLGAIGEIMVGGAGSDFLEIDLSSLSSAISLRLAAQAFSPVELAPNTSIQGFETFHITMGSGSDTLDLRDFTLEHYQFPFNLAESSFDLSAGRDTVWISSTTKGVVNYVTGAEVLNADLSLLNQDVTIYGGGVWTYNGDIDVEFAAGQLIKIIGKGGSGNDSLWGTTGADKLDGGAGNDDFRGEAGADTITGGAGDDKIDGGKGDDLVIYSGLRANFLVTLNRDGTAYVRDLRSGKDNLGKDTLINVEKIKFDDGLFALKDVATNRPPYDLEFGNPQIAETAGIGTTVGWINSFDPEGNKITYILSSNPDGKFKIVGDEVQINARLDYETTKSYKITIVATDSLGASTSANYTVYVFDIDETPVISSNLGGSKASISVDENTKAVTKVVASDPDGKAITYSIIGSDVDLFKIDAKTGVLSFKSAPDFETPKDWGKNNVYDVTVVASDGMNDDKQSIKVTVNDVNEAPVSVAISKATIVENTTIGSTVGTFSAVDPEGTKVSYKLQDNAGGLFKLSGNKLVVAKNIDYEKFQFAKIVVQVKDADGISVAKIFTIKVKDLAEIIRSPSVGGVTEGNIGADILEGGKGNDTLKGLAGDDVLKGATGNDKLYGGLGADDLYGGAGKDKFQFKALSDSTVASSGRDTIFDFSGAGGDKIDLSRIDANSKTTTDDVFSFIGKKDFSGKVGELRYDQKSSGTYIYGDVDGDRKSDFAIHLDDRVSLQNEYFLL